MFAGLWDSSNAGHSLEELETGLAAGKLGPLTGPQFGASSTWGLLCDLCGLFPREHTEHRACLLSYRLRPNPCSFSLLPSSVREDGRNPVLGSLAGPKEVRLSQLQAHRLPEGNLFQQARAALHWSAWTEGMRVRVGMRGQACSYPPASSRLCPARGKIAHRSHGEGTRTSKPHDARSEGSPSFQ